MARTPNTKYDSNPKGEKNGNYEENRVPMLPVDFCDNDQHHHLDLCRLNTKTWSQFLICLTASTVAFNTGVFYGFVGPMLLRLWESTSPIKVTTEDIHFLTLISPAGKILGPIIFSFFLDYAGRKKTAILTLLPSCLGNILIYNAVDTNQFAIGILCVGIGYYAVTVVSVYVVEMTSPHLRDTFGSFGIVQRSFGSFTGYIIAMALPIKTTAMVMSILPIVIIVMISFCPESPYFCLKKGNIVMARKSLSYLYEGDFVEKELNRLQKAVAKNNLENNGKFRDIVSNPKNNAGLKSLILLAIIFFIEIFSGFYAVLIFFPTMLKHARPTLVSPELGGSFIKFSQILALFLSMFLTRFFDKKLLLITSSSLSIFPMLLLSYFYFLNPNTEQYCDSNIPFISIMMYFLTYSIGLGNLPLVYIRELVPLNFVAKVAFMISLLIPFYTFLLMFVHNFISYNFGLQYAFLLFAAVLFFGGVFFNFYLPKTRNKTLENIQLNMMGNRTKFSGGK